MIVKENAPQETTKSGIILTPADQERTYTGTVIVTGNGSYLENGSIRPMEVKVGDTVIFAKFAGTPVTVQGEQYLILNERDILVYIRKDENTSE